MIETAKMERPMPRKAAFLFSSLAVKFFMHFAQVFVGHVRVHLRRSDVGVAEERLHRAQVGTALEEVGRKRVADNVWCDLACDARFYRVFFYKPLDTARSEAQVLC